MVSTALLSSAWLVVVCGCGVCTPKCCSVPTLVWQLSTAALALQKVLSPPPGCGEGTDTGKPSILPVY